MVNSVARGIAIPDLAVRRRFALAGLWRQLHVMEELADPCMKQAFHDLLMILLEPQSRVRRQEPGDAALCLQILTTSIACTLPGPRHNQVGSLR